MSNITTLASLRNAFKIKNVPSEKLYPIVTPTAHSLTSLKATTAPIFVIESYIKAGLVPDDAVFIIPMVGTSATTRLSNWKLASYTGSNISYKYILSIRTGTDSRYSRFYPSVQVLYNKDVYGNTLSTPTFTEDTYVYLQEVFADILKQPAVASPKVTNLGADTPISYAGDYAGAFYALDTYTQMQSYFTSNITIHVELSTISSSAKSMDTVKTKYSKRTSNDPIYTKILRSTSYEFDDDTNSFYSLFNDGNVIASAGKRKADYGVLLTDSELPISVTEVLPLDSSTAVMASKFRFFYFITPASEFSCRSYSPYSSDIDTGEHNICSYIEAMCDGYNEGAVITAGDTDYTFPINDLCCLRNVYQSSKTTDLDTNLRLTWKLTTDGVTVPILLLRSDKAKALTPDGEPDPEPPTPTPTPPEPDDKPQPEPFKPHHGDWHTLPPKEQYKTKLFAYVTDEKMYGPGFVNPFGSMTVSHSGNYNIANVQTLVVIKNPIFRTWATFKSSLFATKAKNNFKKVQEVSVYGSCTITKEGVYDVTGFEFATVNID